MATRYLSCAETAKMLRQSLKEAFPGVKFSVRSSTYSGGESISVRWTDGPNSDQVEEVSGRFEGSYFDGSIDYKGSVYHMIDGEQVRMGTDSVHLNRDYSDAAVARALGIVHRKFIGAGDPPSIDDYHNGRLWSWRSPGGCELYRELSKTLHRHSDRLAGRKSATAGKVMITHDDGYSRMCGAGHSATQPD
jgi:hypothetical protein